jgi:uncharacterized protein YfaP (DUF2135 family)
MGGMNGTLFRALLCLLVASPLAALTVTIDTPSGGYWTERLVTVSGSVSDPAVTAVRLIHNGIGWTSLVTRGRFSQKLLAARGDNIFIVEAVDGEGKRARAEVSLYANVPKTDFRVFLYWDVVPGEYIDLWVEEPDGQICKWNLRKTKLGGTLYDLYSGDIGRGPQYYALDNAPPGNYGFSVHYYAKKGPEPRRCSVVIVLFEGTDREKRLHYTFPLLRQHSEFIVKDIRVGLPD